MPINSASKRFLDIDFDSLSNIEAAEAIKAMSRNDSFSYVVTPNVDHVLTLFPSTASNVSADFALAYKEADLRLCDSRILRLLARLRNIDLSVVTGSDLTASLFHRHFSSTDTVAIIGGDNLMPQTLSERFPGPHYVQHIPPMGVLSNSNAMDAIIDFVREQRAHYVLFAIGAPQSEIIAYRCKKAGACVGVGLCIGASIEFILGQKARAPVLMQRLNLEWAFRLLSEPRRLWRRYLVKGPRIFWLAAKWRKA
jgi:N-acetylglucosaminyldiphosphoundecaprenol N-acetyl-beta-D-mannosaminyltransferase